MKNKGQTVAVVDKPRYDDVFADGEKETGEGVRARQVPSIGKDGAPLPAPVIVMSSPDRNVDQDDIDRPMRREPPDWLSQQLGDPVFSSGVSFDWSRNGFNVLHRYSRRYPNLSVIVDMFGKDNDAVRAEVAQKRARIIAHNESARADLTAVENRYTHLLKSAKNDGAREVAGQWKAAAYTYRRREGLMPFGYLPILAGNAFPDAESAKKGDVLDLPERHPKADHPVGGIGNSSRYV